MAYSYPILLDLTGKVVVIVGGGRVAVRKAEGLLEGGATRVRCIALEFHALMPNGVEKVSARFEPRHLDGASIAFAATDSADVNIDVVRAARERGILVSKVDEDDHGDFIVPANWRSGEIIVSVSTGLPRLSVALRDELKKDFTSINKYEQMVELMQRLRPWLYNSSLHKVKQIKALVDLTSEEAFQVLEKSGGQGLYHWLVERYPELKLEKAP